MTEADDKKVQIKPLDPSDVEGTEVSGLVAVELEEANAPEGRMAVAGLPVAILKFVAGNVAYDVAKAGAKWLLADPNINLNDRPPTLYHEPTQQVFRLQPDGSYLPSNQVIL